jgi:hypothetical protein
MESRASLFYADPAQLRDASVPGGLGNEECQELRRGVADSFRALIGNALSADALTGWESAAYPVRIVPATAWDQKKPFPASTLDRVRRSEDVVP